MPIEALQVRSRSIVSMAIVSIRLSTPVALEALQSKEQIHSKYGHSKYSTPVALEALKAKDIEHPHEERRLSERCHSKRSKYGKCSTCSESGAFPSVAVVSAVNIASVVRVASIVRAAPSRASP